jgi:acetylornithine deacetylase/succinyl-diaminopimelate desuccinylase-like protein
MPAWESYLAQHRNRFLEEYLDYLRIPSISAQDEHAGDVARAGQWVADRLTGIGIQNVEIMPTGGHPVVYGDWSGAPGKPTVLVYGHFDVQPVDPLALWTSPPFEPTIREDRVYARGASDNKGNLFVALMAIEAMLKNGALPVNLKFLIEGQEEIGSPQLKPFVEANAGRFASDLVLSTDGGSGGADPPQVVTGCRGVTAMEVDVRGPNSDLHSGSFGGAVHNPVHALVRILDSMRSPDGRVLVEGFYDDVEFTDDDRREIAAVPFDEAQFMQRLGIDALFGEPGYSPRERLWARPTLEINGIWGGYQGEGTKTVLPAEAHAKITCRLVPNQDPARIRDALAEHVRKHAPPGVTAIAHPGRVAEGARAYRMRADHPANRAAFEVLEKVRGQPPFFGRMGGTVPVYELLVHNLGVQCVSFGQGAGDERAHAPDEFFRFEAFDRGPRAYALLLERLSAEAPDALRQG